MNAKRMRKSKKNGFLCHKHGDSFAYRSTATMDGARKILDKMMSDGVRPCEWFGKLGGFSLKDIQDRASHGDLCSIAILDACKNRCLGCQ